jgi:hypothetical protein
LSETESAHPWSRHYAEKGGARPDLTLVPGFERADAGEPVAEDGRLIGALPEAPPAAARSVATGDALKIDWHATPQIELFTAADLERVRRETEARRWSDTLGTLRLLGSAVAALALLVLGFELMQRLANRLPSDAALAAHGAQLGAEFLRTYASDAQPLSFGGSAAVRRDSPSATHARYEFTVTLRLREPLYAPAASNGAQAYLDLQRAVADAHGRFVASRRYADFPELANPVELPALLAMTHRAGERLIVRVPVTATRRLFGWRLASDLAAARVLTPAFTGEVLARQPAASLIFGQTGARDAMRQRQDEARAYVLAVQRALATSTPPGRR